MSLKAISDHDHGTKRRCTDHTTTATMVTMVTMVTRGRGKEGRSYNLRLAGRGGHLGRVQLFPGPKPHAELATADNKLSFGQFP